MDNQFNFNISLSVLNHLGRNLYRNVITVIGEAISNSWDADATNVWIQIDRDNKTMCILDDGIGMNPDDFQNKFLKIGYSKRKNGNYKTRSGRVYIGRKGIGKLALLSCAKRIHIASKVDDGELIGGIIDNSGLDEAIKDDLNSQDYILGHLERDFSTDMNKLSHGTLILFEEVNNGIFNTVEYVKKAVALYFRFALLDENFHIYINDEEITEKLLSDFSQNTQFLWKINGIKDPMIDAMDNLREISMLESSLPIKGYIASVQKPSQIKIRGTQEKVTIDLFVNGRLREKDILRHIPTARIVENYVYGQIHYDILDTGESKDIFTSSREGVISDDPLFKGFLAEVERLFKLIIDDWDRLRRKYGDDGDPDNQTISRKARKAQELYNSTIDELDDSRSFARKGGQVERWVQELSEEAQFNIPSYTECFISENLLRKYTDFTKLPLTKEAQAEAEKWKKKEATNKDKANISYDVRKSDSPTFYLDMTYLSNWIDKAKDKTKNPGLSRSATTYKPMRDAVGHTSLLTDIAKHQLTVEYENIKARLVKLLKEFDAQNKEE